MKRVATDRLVSFFRRASGGRAFTLIEVTLVVVIIALIGALAIPSFINALHGQRLDSAAHDIANVSQEARLQAVSSGRTCWYVVDIEQQEVRLLQEPATDTNDVVSYETIAAETNILTSATAEELLSKSMPEGVKIASVVSQDALEQTAGAVGFPYYNNGVCEPFRVFLRTETDEVRGIDIDMFTGKADVFTPAQ